MREIRLMHAEVVHRRISSGSVSLTTTIPPAVIEKKYWQLPLNCQITELKKSLQDGLTIYVDKRLAQRFRLQA